MFVWLGIPDIVANFISYYSYKRVSREKIRISTLINIRTERTDRCAQESWILD